MTFAFDSNKNKNCWKDMTDIAEILIKNNYDVLLRYEDCGIYCMDVEVSRHLAQEMGSPYLDTVELNDETWEYEYKTES